MNSYPLIFLEVYFSECILIRMKAVEKMENVGRNAPACPADDPSPHQFRKPPWLPSVKHDRNNPHNILSFLCSTWLYPLKKKAYFWDFLSHVPCGKRFWFYRVLYHCWDVSTQMQSFSWGNSWGNVVLHIHIQDNSRSKMSRKSLNPNNFVALFPRRHLNLSWFLAKKYG